MLTLHIQQLAALAVLTVATLGAQAHGVWVAQRTGEWTLVLGDGPVDDAYPAQAIKSVQAIDGDGAPVEVKLRPQARNTVLDGAVAPAVFAVSYEDGYWTQGSDGKWVAGPKSQMANARKAGYYTMYTTTLVAPLPAAYQPFGLPLEIVPMADPMRLKRGQALVVRVLLDGKPLAGARVQPDHVNDSHGQAVPTDARGLARLTLRSSGLNVIKVNHTRPRTDRRDADEDGLAATLAFTLPQPKD